MNYPISLLYGSKPPLPGFGWEVVVREGNSEGGLLKFQPALLYRSDLFAVGFESLGRFLGLVSCINFLF